MTVKGRATAKVDSGTVVAETAEWEEVDGNIYFPPDSIKKQYFAESTHHTDCRFKGQASYYTITVDGTELKNVAWYYPTPKPAFGNIAGHVAFYKNKVDIENVIENE